MNIQLLRVHVESDPNILGKLGRRYKGTSIQKALYGIQQFNFLDGTVGAVAKRLLHVAGSIPARKKYLYDSHVVVQGLSVSVCEFECLLRTHNTGEIPNAVLFIYKIKIKDRQIEYSLLCRLQTIQITSTEV